MSPGAGFSPASPDLRSTFLRLRSLDPPSPGRRLLEEAVVRARRQPASQSGCRGSRSLPQLSVKTCHCDERSLILLPGPSLVVPKEPVQSSPVQSSPVQSRPVQARPGQARPGQAFYRGCLTRFSGPTSNCSTPPPALPDGLGEKPWSRVPP